MKWMHILSFCFALCACAEDIARTKEGFPIPTAKPQFQFPRDHGSHPEYRIEWWYITGQFRDEQQGRYGFQATFFRYALNPEGRSRKDALGQDQLYMAHMAITDVSSQRFLYEERLNRDGWDAHASAKDLDVRNGNWSLKRIEKENMHLLASVRDAVEMDFMLSPAKPKVLFGDAGLSRKGEAPSAASWYITFPRLQLSGTLRLDGEERKVRGEAWMDHEISSSQLDKHQVGWDWISVRFKDQTEMMIYQLRDKEGKSDPYSTLAWIDREGKVTHMGPDQFSWTGKGTWKSEKTGAEYPIDVELTGSRPDGRPFRFKVRPLMRAQELSGALGGIAYWEGACEILEENEVIGEAYMELTGYSESLGESLQ